MLSSSLSILVLLVSTMMEQIHCEIIGDIVLILIVLTLTNKVLFELGYDFFDFVLQNHLFYSNLTSRTWWFNHQFFSLS